MTTSSHTVTFERNGLRCAAEYTCLNRSGRLHVEIDGLDVACWEWIDYDPALFTDDGLTARALSEIEHALRFNADPANFGEGEAPDRRIIDLCARVLASR